MRYSIYIIVYKQSQHGLGEITPQTASAMEMPLLKAEVEELPQEYDAMCNSFSLPMAFHLKGSGVRGQGSGKTLKCIWFAL